MNFAVLKQGVLGVLVTAVVGSAAAAHAGEKHACLAYSEASHRYGWAADQPDDATATSKAIASCGAGCTARLNWHAGCGAYAEGSQNVHYGWSLGATKDAATSAALAACSRVGGVGCTIRNWACN